MTLNYKTQAYIIRALRHAILAQRLSGGWVASLPMLGLTVVAPTRDDAEAELAGQVVTYIFRAEQHGWHLPRIGDVDLEIGEDSDALTDEQVYALDGLAEDAVSEYEAGRTTKVEDFARENNITLDVG